MNKQKESYTESTLNQTPEQKADAYAKKLKDLEDIAYNKGYVAGEKKKKRKSEKLDKDKNHNKDGTFADGNKLAVGNGRPAIFKNPEELAEKINYYIINCPDVQKCYTTDGAEYEKKIPTISGMAYYLGFQDRQSMYDYEKKDDRFSCIIKRARLWMERHYEQLAQGKTPAGPIFALKNMSWSEKTEVKHSGEMTQKNIELSKEDYIKARKEMLENDEC